MSADAEWARQRGLPLPATWDFRGLVERLPLIVYVDAANASSTSLYVSPQTTKVLGHTPEDWASIDAAFARNDDAD